MTQTLFEHINMTVSDPDRTAKRLGDLYGWHVRWSGTAKNDGYSVHVGTDHQYLALYTMGKAQDPAQSSYEAKGGLNHLGIVVDDLDGAERRVLAAGYETYSHQDYEPGRRFYYRDEDGIEFEVISYREDR